MYDYFFNTKSLINKLDDIYNFINTSEQNQNDIINLKNFIININNEELTKEIELLLI